MAGKHLALNLSLECWVWLPSAAHLVQNQQGSKLVVVRWPEATKFSAGPPEHWVVVVQQATEIFQTKIV